MTAHIIYLSLRRIAGAGSSCRPGWDNIVGGSSARLADVFSAVLVVGYAYHQRVVYGEGRLGHAEDERPDTRIFTMTLYGPHHEDPAA